VHNPKRCGHVYEDECGPTCVLDSLGIASSEVAESDTPIGPGPDPQGAAAAARTALARMQSDHAGAPILKAIAQRLCQDIDDTDRVLDRIAATREVVRLLNVLDGALFAGRPPVPPGDDEAPEEEARPDDPFKIGDLPPGMGDSPA
jgi:hypothetical protein